MESLGFESPESDACPFRNNELGMIAAPDTKLIDRTRDGLKRSYDLEELGEDKRFLGFDVIRDREARKKAYYMKDTGAVSWVAYGTRPDIAYTVSRLAEANRPPWLTGCHHGTRPVAKCTTEAEFADLAPAALSVYLWVARIFLNAYLTVMNPLNKARTRAIDIQYKWAIE
ncbi:hypothetical protein L209DRAFT_679137 [Thermothelomyces heterothallicus CBS 203.75]